VGGERVGGRLPGKAKNVFVKGGAERASGEASGA